MRTRAPEPDPSAAHDELGRDGSSASGVPWVGSAGRRAAGRGHRGRRERGATLVEYALLMAALVVPTIAAINFVQDGAEAEINRTATGISSKTIPSVPTTTAG